MNGPARRIAGVLVVALVAVLVAGACGPAARADALRDKILDSKYSRGDYAVYLGWHDPADWQFDEHGTYVLPFGLKVRMRGLGWLRFEADVQYYRKTSSSSLRVSVFKGPEFDSFSTGLAAQWLPFRRGPVRPYVGAGLIFVSLGNDFVAFRPDVYAAQPSNPDQFVLASWGEWDLGWQAMGGLEFPTGYRAFPFVEFRYISGTVEFGARDVQLGTLSAGGIGLDISDLQTVPEDPEVGGRPHEGRFDWSGPLVSLGLKIRF
ncbi:hypothetical protein K8I85_01500 [bacterium]|nr:hypothetical protein [bacterium]